MPVIVYSKYQADTVCELEMVINDHRPAKLHALFELRGFQVPMSFE